MPTTTQPSRQGAASPLLRRLKALAERTSTSVVVERTLADGTVIAVETATFATKTGVRTRRRVTAALVTSLTERGG